MESLSPWHTGLQWFVITPICDSVSPRICFSHMTSKGHCHCPAAIQSKVQFGLWPFYGPVALMECVA